MSTKQKGYYSMDNYNYITITNTYEHLSLEHYEHIIREITKHDAFHNGKKRNTGRTALIRSLASTVGTSVSNVYLIIKDASILVQNSDLTLRCELSASAAFHKRSKVNKISHVSKLEKAQNFIKLIVKEVKTNTLSSIDETVNNLILHHSDKIVGMDTVCTKTIYNYVHQGKIDLKPMDLPRMIRRKPKKNYKEYIPKRQKGTPISERPFEMDDRSEFGHWEGDLVTGPRDGHNGAYLTLLERKSRYYIMIPISKKSSKLVYMKINQIHKFYGDAFSSVLKSITFDNGSEFARYRDIECKPGSKEKRTSVYFGRPYHSCDRASNENCNALLRRFIKKGTDINTVDKTVSLSINQQINHKKRKILGYISAQESFLNELTILGLSDDFCFYS